jgi:hypothetical protein
MLVCSVHSTAEYRVITNDVSDYIQAVSEKVGAVLGVNSPAQK